MYILYSKVDRTTPAGPFFLLGGAGRARPGYHLNLGPGLRPTQQPFTAFAPSKASHSKPTIPKANLNQKKSFLGNLFLEIHVLKPTLYRPC